MRNKEKQKQYHREWSSRNREKIRKWSKEYYEKHKEKRLKKQKEWYLKNKKKKDEYLKKWWSEHKEWDRKRCRSENYLEKKRKRNRERRITDLKFKLDRDMATIIGRALRGKKAGQKWQKLVGYTIEDLIKHLEKQFDEKMNWNNHGLYWHIDHVKPKSLFHYEKPEDLEFKKCWALKNLQPLEKITNIRKGNKY